MLENICGNDYIKLLPFERIQPLAFIQVALNSDSADTFKDLGALWIEFDRAYIALTIVSQEAKNCARTRAKLQHSFFFPS
ncbi:hypothetical protein GCM10011396_38320 [Undibacterium terreum]|uniref:Uncharacterized protein n=1 Tax=Undibacterium terreum TaxID=1224302 RepID=A0A916UUC1_9BURK|nr:hypothetical protein GCM10011396_38320 [Undibacterium terreum]